jgi:uncharacterized integral membrane protein
MRQLRALIFILFAVLIIILVVQNYEAMSTSVTFRVNLLFFEHETPKLSLYVLSVLWFLLGVVVMGLYGVRERFRMQRRIKDLMKETAQKTRELNALRNLAITREDVNPVPGTGEH